MGVEVPARGGHTWTVAEPPNWRLDEWNVLRELMDAADDPENGLHVVLWNAVRLVRLWADTPTPVRTRLFSGVPASETTFRMEQAAEEAPELSGSLEIFAKIVRRRSDVRPEWVITACQTVSTWAERFVHLETAMQFAEAAAAVNPHDPALANAAGRVCRRAGQPARAELWYERAIGLARKNQNVRQYISGQLGSGAILRDRGQHHMAMRFIKRAALTAKRAGLRNKAAEAFQDALGIAVLDGDLGRATVYAKRALAVYPRHHQRFPAFAYDLSFLMVCRGMYAPALSLLASVVPKITFPGEQLVVRGTLARAAGGTGQRDRFWQVARLVEADAPVHPAYGAGALYSLAEGARLLGDWEEAERLTEAAIRLAKETDAGVALEYATQLRAEVAARNPGIPPLTRDAPAGALLRRLAPEVRLRLRRWRGSSWRPRRREKPFGHQPPEPNPTPLP